jgi:hypothetical protein
MTWHRAAGLIQPREQAAELAGELGIQALRATRPKQGFEALVPKPPDYHDA